MKKENVFQENEPGLEQGMVRKQGQGILFPSLPLQKYLTSAGAGCLLWVRLAGTGHILASTYVCPCRNISPWSGLEQGRR